MLIGKCDNLKKEVSLLSWLETVRQ